ncbi:hypothetical protein E2C01_061304 [Portunus trituberculatus]|uniref:Uncharacterized protein n=1 Tax=Portunus trituberculatus TaxID=210409 RepID=A0A5B7HE10_PORTR|nr:hypothetical protein [Portunus trituberculatus]
MNSFNRNEVNETGRVSNMHHRSLTHTRPEQRELQRGRRTSVPRLQRHPGTPPRNGCISHESYQRKAPADPRRLDNGVRAALGSACSVGDGCLLI